MNTTNIFTRVVGLMVFATMAIGVIVFAGVGASPALARLGTLAADNRPAQNMAAGAPVLLLLHVDALVLDANGDAATVTADVLDASGKPVPGVTVQFGGSLGTVSPSSALTDADGHAAVLYNAGPVPGQAILAAEVGGLRQEAALQIVKPGVEADGQTLTLSVDTATLKPGAQMQITARLVDSLGQPVVGQPISIFGALGEVSPASAISDGDGRISAAYRAGGILGAARITGSAGYASSSVVVTIATETTPTPTATPTVTPTATATPIDPQIPGDGSKIYLPSVRRGN